MKMTQKVLRSGLIVCLGIMLTMGMVGAPLTGFTTDNGVAAGQEEQEEGPEIEMIGDLESSGIFMHSDYDGSVEVLVGINYHFESDEERERFDDLADDPNLEDEIAASFAEDLREIAAETDEIDEEDIRNPGARIEIASDEVGIVDVWVEWDELLVADDDELVLTEPYASGFGPQTDALQNAGLPAEEEEYVGVEPTPLENLVVWVPQRGADHFTHVHPEPIETADEGHVIGMDMSDGFDEDFEVRIDPADEAEIGSDAGDETDEDGFSLEGQTSTYIGWTVATIVVAALVGAGIFAVKRYRK